MIAAVHALVGGALGAALGNPAAAAAAGLASHALLDLVPHADYRTTRAGVVDFAAGLLLALVAGRHAGASALVGALAGMLPDVEVALSHLGWNPLRRNVFPTHNGLLPHAQAAPPLGAATQLLLGGAAAWALWHAGR